MISQAKYWIKTPLSQQRTYLISFITLLLTFQQSPGVAAVHTLLCSQPCEPQDLPPCLAEQIDLNLVEIMRLSTNLDLQFYSGILSKQVPQLLIINFYIRNSNIKNSVLILLGFFAFKYMDNGPRNETWKSKKIYIDAYTKHQLIKYISKYG